MHHCRKYISLHTCLVTARCGMVFCCPENRCAQKHSQLRRLPQRRTHGTHT